MRVYSTLLNIKPEMTKEDFIKLVIEWNQNNPHKDNVILGMVWNGEKNIRFGNDKIWLEILDYTNKNIVAVRYEKKSEDGVAWDTDYIMNFNDMKMAIQLDRSYREDVITTGSDFSTPLFISTLIKHDCLLDDGNLKIDKKPILLTQENLELFTNAVIEKSENKLPIVFISKTSSNTDPIDVNLLASKLKGTAHVMLQDDRTSNKYFRTVCKGENAYNGDVGVYYPNSSLKNKKIFYYRDLKKLANPLSVITDYIFKRGNSKNIKKLYTWNGLNNDVLNERLGKQIKELENAKTEKTKAENDLSELYSSLDEELKELQQKVKDLTIKNEALIIENQVMFNKLTQNTSAPLIFCGNEKEYFHDEIKDFILSSLSETVSRSETGSRKKDVLADIVQSNDYQHLLDKRRKQLVNIFKGYKNVSDSMQRQLKDMGFAIEKGKHYKLTYNGDERYLITVSSTPSDCRSGENTIAKISNKVF